MAYETAGLNAAVDGIATVATYVGLLDDTSSPVGTERKAATWAAADAGERDLNADIEFTMVASEDVAYWAAYTAASEGTLLGKWALTPVRFGDGDTLTYTLLASSTKLTATNPS